MRLFTHAALSEGIGLAITWNIFFITAFKLKLIYEFINGNASCYIDTVNIQNGSTPHKELSI